VVVLLAAAAQPNEALHAHPAVETYKSLSARHTATSLDGAQESEKLPQEGRLHVVERTLHEPTWHGANALDWPWRSHDRRLLRLQ